MTVALNEDMITRITRAVAQEMVGYKHDLPAGFAVTANLMHGPAGIFGQAGLEPDIFSTRITPRGLTEVLPAMGSITTDPVVGYLTGFTDEESAAEPISPCDDPLETGDIKSCYQGSAFGRIIRKTKTLRLVDLGLQTNRGEFMDLRLVNDPLLNADFGIPGLSAQARFDFNREVLARLLALGVVFQNKLAAMNWTGDPANNSAQDGYMEFSGLETLVGTGKVDVITNASCPSLDSDIKDFNYRSVDDNGADLIRYLTYLWRFVRHNGIRMNMEPIQWLLAMREELFVEITDVWPCLYNTFRCTSGSGDVVGQFDATAMRDLSNDMRNGMYLKLDNVNVPVVVDDGIPELTSGDNANIAEGCFASDIYLLPVTVRGGRPVLFYEFRDFQRSVAPEIAAAGLGNIALVSDAGRFLWYSQFTNGCFSLAATFEPRLRLLTPHLAGRLEHVQYCPLQHFRQPFPDDPYQVDGGNQTKSNKPYYADRQ